MAGQAQEFPGYCLGNYDGTAEECKECLMGEECDILTKEKGEDDDGIIDIDNTSGKDRHDASETVERGDAQ